LRKVNKKVLESLIKCGAFDSTNVQRSQLFAVYEAAMEKGQQAQKQKNDKQKSLFEAFDTNGSKAQLSYKYPDIAEWGESELLSHEKETLGFFISSHPLVSYERDLKKFSTIDTSKIHYMNDGEEVKIGGVPVTINEIKTRRGERMAFVTIEDLKGSIEIIVFAELYKDVAAVLKGEQPIMIKGKVSIDANNQKAKVRAEVIMPLSEAFKKLPSSVHFNLDTSIITKPQLEKFKNILKSHPGECAAFLHLFIPSRSETIITLPAELRLNPSEALFQEVEYLFGSHVITLH